MRQLASLGGVPSSGRVRDSTQSGSLPSDTVWLNNLCTMQQGGGGEEFPSESCLFDKLLPCDCSVLPVCAGLWSQVSVAPGWVPWSRSRMC